MGPTTSPLRLRSTGDRGGVFGAAGGQQQQQQQQAEEEEDDLRRQWEPQLEGEGEQKEEGRDGLDSGPEDSEAEAEQELVEPSYSGPWVGGRPPKQPPSKLDTPLGGSTGYPYPLFLGSPPPYGPDHAQAGLASSSAAPPAPYPLSVSFGPAHPPGGGSGGGGGLRRQASSVLSRSAEFFKPNVSTGLRLFILFAITWSATMTTCLGPFFPIYMRERFHASSMLIGLVFSVTSFSQFVACPVVAPFSHQFSRVAALRTGLAILLAGGLIFGILDHPAGFIFGRILQVGRCVRAPTQP